VKLTSPGLSAKALGKKVKFDLWCYMTFFGGKKPGHNSAEAGGGKTTWTVRDFGWNKKG